jgi:hypothetical protein
MGKKVRGHAMIEAVLAIPLAVILMLGFVDMARLVGAQTYLWVWGRQWVRVLAQAPAQSEAAWEWQVQDDFMRRQIPLKAAVRFVPVELDLKPHPYRKNKVVEVIELTLRYPLEFKFPLFRQIYDGRAVTLEVFVYEARSHS